MSGLATVLFGLASAMAWGAGDFTGGLTSRRASVYGVVIYSELFGLLGLLLLVAIFGEAPPAAASHLLAAIAGICGGTGIVLLYIALASGQMSQAAPVSAVVAAAIPVIVTAAWRGMPGPLTLLGLLLALAAIWLIANTGGANPGGDSATGIGRLRPGPQALLGSIWQRLNLPIIAGITFGLYFVLLNQASQQSLYWPLIDARLSSVIFLTLFAMLARRRVAIGRANWIPVALVGILDTGGNILYVLAGQSGRMDVAAVISSLYPAGTVLLAWLLLKERISRSQLAGILAALLAILLITV